MVMGVIYFVERRHLMELYGQLKQNREEIFNQWFEVTIQSYPEDTARIFAKSGNKFDNPVGSSTKHSLEQTLELILGAISDKGDKPIDEKSVEDALDAVIRIRAVQSFSASQAVKFIFELKTIVKTVLAQPVDDRFDRIIDQVALAAFNRFMKCRENIFLLRATEAKRRVHRAFERAGLVTELQENDLLGSNKS